MTSVCPVCHVRISHRRQSLEEHRKKMHDAAVSLSGDKDLATSNLGKSGSLKRKAEAISKSKQAHPSSKKKVKSSTSTPPPPLLEDEPTEPAIKSTIVVIPETKELEKETRPTIDLSLDEFGKEVAFPEIDIPVEKEAVVETVVTCPICSAPIASASELVINRHIDECLSMKFLNEEEQKKAPPPKMPPLDDSMGTEEEDYDEEEEEEEEEEDGSMGSPRDFFHKSSDGFTSASSLGLSSVPVAAPVPKPTVTTRPVIATASSAPAPAILGELQALQQMLVAQRNRLYGTESTELPVPLFEAEEERRDAGQRPDSVVLDRKIEDKECSICFEEFNAGAEVRWLECLCVYHTECIRGWFKKSGTRVCPMHPDS